MLHDYNKRTSVEKLTETLKKFESDRHCNVVARNRICEQKLRVIVEGHNGINHQRRRMLRSHLSNSMTMAEDLRTIHNSANQLHYYTHLQELLDNQIDNENLAENGQSGSNNQLINKSRFPAIAHNNDIHGYRKNIRRTKNGHPNSRDIPTLSDSQRLPQYSLMPMVLPKISDQKPVKPIENHRHLAISTSKTPSYYKRRYHGNNMMRAPVR